MNDSSVKRNDKPRVGDGLKPLFSKSLNRTANIGDLMEETITKGSKSVKVFFRPLTKQLFVPNGAITEHRARECGVHMIRMFDVPYYDAQVLIDKNLIEFKHLGGFRKRTKELIDHFISEWTGAE